MFLEMLSDSKNHVDFLVNEISEHAHTILSLCFRFLFCNILLCISQHHLKDVRVIIFPFF